MRKHSTSEALQIRDELGAKESLEAGAKEWLEAGAKECLEADAAELVISVLWREIRDE